MTISLVSAPVLGFDLVRHPRGSAVAGTLLFALSLGPQDLPAFGERLANADADARAAAWKRVHAVQSTLGSGALNGSNLAGTEGDGTAGSLAGVIEGLRRSLIVDLDDLEHLLRADVLGWSGAAAGQESPARVTGNAEAAATLIMDALAADWVDGLDTRTRADLADGIRPITIDVPARLPDVGPCEDEVHGLLAVLRTLDAGGRRRLRIVNQLLRSTGATWAEAVHEASWAALTTGRIRAAAVAQLLAAQAFLTGGLDAADGAEGVWNLVSGHVHALVVADVLPVRTQVALARAWRSAIPIG